ncbi:hypothetical protein C8R43DRAFT_942598 [Mycena crocata]|nr:hypothetical protein C8R43DRAFT_942598 [Mycena crocata]
MYRGDKFHHTFPRHDMTAIRCPLCNDTLSNLDTSTMIRHIKKDHHGVKGPSATIARNDPNKWISDPDVKLGSINIPSSEISTSRFVYPDFIGDDIEQDSGDDADSDSVNNSSSTPTASIPRFTAAHRRAPIDMVPTYSQNGRNPVRTARSAPMKPFAGVVSMISKSRGGKRGSKAPESSLFVWDSKAPIVFPQDEKSDSLPDEPNSDLDGGSALETDPATPPAKATPKLYSPQYGSARTPGPEIGNVIDSPMTIPAHLRTPETLKLWSPIKPRRLSKTPGPEIDNVIDSPQAVPDHLRTPLEPHKKVAADVFTTDNSSTTMGGYPLSNAGEEHQPILDVVFETTPSQPEMTTEYTLLDINSELEWVLTPPGTSLTSEEIVSGKIASEEIVSDEESAMTNTDDKRLVTDGKILDSSTYLAASSAKGLNTDSQASDARHVLVVFYR